MTLNDAIVSVLKIHGRPMRPVEILNEVINRGLYSQKAGGPPTSSQVNTRLNRKTELFEKVGPGLYKLKSASPEMGMNPTNPGKITPVPKPAQYPNPLAKQMEALPAFADSNNTERKQGLPPVVGPKPKVLILGTLPGDVSLRQQQYYANAGNRFWKLMQEVLGEAAPFAYDEKLKWLHKHHIALWDVLATAVRQGSLDSAIEQEQPNDLAAFLRKHPSITHIGLNGGKAQEAFAQHFAFLPELKGVRVLSLYSTSPANQAISMKRLTVQWQELFNS